MNRLRMLLLILTSFCGVFFFTANAGATTWPTFSTTGSDFFYVGWNASAAGGLGRMQACDMNSGTLTDLQTTWTLDANQVVDMQDGDDELHIVLGQFNLTVCGVFLKEVRYNGHSVALIGGAGDDIISGGDGDDLIHGDDALSTDCTGSGSFAGADILDGKYGTNTLRGCGGNDQAINNCNAPSSDSIYGNLGNDCLYVRSGSATVFDCGGQTLDKRKSLPTGTGCTSATGSCGTTGYGDPC